VNKSLGEKSKDVGRNIYDFLGNAALGARRRLDELKGDIQLAKDVATIPEAREWYAGEKRKNLKDMGAAVRRTLAGRKGKEYEEETRRINRELVNQLYDRKETGKFSPEETADLVMGLPSLHSGENMGVYGDVISEREFKPYEGRNVLDLGRGYKGNREMRSEWIAAYYDPSHSTLAMDPSLDFSDVNVLHERAHEYQDKTSGMTKFYDSTTGKTVNRQEFYARLKQAEYNDPLAAEIIGWAKKEAAMYSNDPSHIPSEIYARLATAKLMMPKEQFKSIMPEVYALLPWK
jgi:hypothetical protein